MSMAFFGTRRVSTTSCLEFERLDSLPCGCVAASYRAPPWSIALLRLEAKGPHCIRREHAVGHVVGVGAAHEPDNGQDKGGQSNGGD